MVKFSTVQLPTPPSSSLFHQGLGNQTPSSTPQIEREDVDPEPARWTNSEEEAIFVHLMVKEVRKGNKKKATFSQRAWENIEQGFYEKTRKKNILSQLKNKFSTLKARYSDFNKLLKEPGFSWNPAIGHATATNADWESCIKANKRARVFLKKGCPLYNELGIIYGDPVAGCQNATPSIQCSLDSEFKCGAEDESTKSCPIYGNPVAGCQNATQPMQCSLDSEFKCGAEDESTKSSQSNSAKDSVEPYATLRAGHFRQQSLPPLVDQIKCGTDATPIVDCQPKKELDQLPLPYATSKIEVSGPKTPNSSHADPKSFSTDFSITSCIKCLESIQGIDSKTYLKAVKMFKDVDWREMFMAMSAERRLDWLGSLE